MSFRAEVPPGLKFRTDRWTLQVILIHLLENSIRFRAAARPCCRISAEITDEALHLKGEDNGIGIPVENQEEVFGMFKRAHHETLGNGLGLFNVKLAVDKLGGKVTLQSKPGEGTAIRIALPPST